MAAGRVDHSLDIFVVSLRLLNNQVAPVYTADPADQVDRCEELDKANTQLSLVDVRVTKTSTDHRASAGKEDVEDKANICPADANLGSIGGEFPDAQVLWVDFHDSLLHILHTNIITRDTETLWARWRAPTHLLLRHFKL